MNDHLQQHCPQETSALTGRKRGRIHLFMVVQGSGETLILALQQWYEDHNHKEAIQLSCSHAGRNARHSSDQPLHTLLIRNIFNNFCIPRDVDCCVDHGLGVGSDVFTAVAERAMEQYAHTKVAKQDYLIIWPWIQLLRELSVLLLLLLLLLPLFLLLLLLLSLCVLLSCLFYYVCFLHFHAVVPFSPMVSCCSFLTCCQSASSYGNV